MGKYIYRLVSMVLRHWYEVKGKWEEGDSGVRNHKALQVASEVRETLD